MNSNKNFVASLIAAVGAFMVLPIAIVSAWQIIDMWAFSNFAAFDFHTLLMVIAALVAIAVFVVETIFVIRAKNDKNGKVFNLVSIILNGLLLVLSLVLFIWSLVNNFSMASGADFVEVLLMILTTLQFPIVGATSGVACGFKLFDLLKK